MPGPYLDPQAYTLSQAPTHPKIFNPQQEITFPDMHGNVLKLLHGAALEGILTISSEQYETLAKIYLTDPADLTPHDLRNFAWILHCCAVKPCTLRLIGDLLCERGRNDALMLLTLRRLHRGDVNLKIVASNHDLEFAERHIQAKECAEVDALPPIYARQNDASTLRADQALWRSSRALATLLTTETLSHHQIEEWVERYYFRHLILIDYVLENNAIHLFSHGGIDVGTIQAHAQRYQVAYEDASAQALAATLDQVNAAFRNSVKTGSFIQTFQNERFDARLHDPYQCHPLGAYTNRHPLMRTTANRHDAVIVEMQERNHLFVRALNHNYCLNFPIRPYCITVVHGHTGPKGLWCNYERCTPHVSIHNIDVSDYGKSPTQDTQPQAGYTVFYTPCRIAAPTPASEPASTQQASTTQCTANLEKEKSDQFIEQLHQTHLKIIEQQQQQKKQATSLHSSPLPSLATYLSGLPRPRAIRATAPQPSPFQPDITLKS